MADVLVDTDVFIDHGLSIATRNRSDFGKVRGVRIRDLA